MKLDPSHFYGTKQHCERVRDKWNIYTLKLNSSDPNIWVFYVGATGWKVEDRVAKHLDDTSWGCPYVKERGVELIVDHFTFSYEQAGTSYKAIEKVETEVAKRLCARLRQVQEINPNIKFLVVGPKNFKNYLSDEEILERAKN